MMPLPTLVLLATLGPAVLAQDAPPPAGTDEQRAAERLEFMIESAAVYELTRAAADADGRGERLPLHPRPVLRWDNPVSGVKDGIIAMWTAGDGRPEAVAQVFISRDGVWMHEFQSLSEQPLDLTRSGQRVWAPSEAGVTLKPVPDGPAPAKGQAARLAQMRLLARQFTASVDFKIDFRDAKTSRYELRLLPRPVYRYGAEDSRLIDGAVFAFVQGTNPEVFLLLEARQTADGPQWQYALAPMTGYSVQAQHRSGLAWESENKQKYRGRTDMPYMVTRFEN
jgi:hypothetical protein